jgi:hypothetical protein
METKEQLINTIKEWVKIDNEMKALQTELKVRRTAQQKISTSLIETMKKENIDGVDLNNGTEQLSYMKKTIKKPITKSLLLNILSKYYSGDSNKATELNTFILDNREEFIKEAIVLKKYK